MSQHFYDAQIKRYFTQFIRMMSNFSYKNNSGQEIQVPARTNDITRQVAQILKQNSENTVPSAPYIACGIKSIDLHREYMTTPTHVSKTNVRERAFDEQNNEYLNIQGENYTIERMAPSPYKLQLTADIWTTNTDQKMQILEQILCLFNPSLELQSSDNYFDWASLTVVELTGIQYTSRTIPQGLEQEIDIATLTFTCPIWISTPAKVKKLGIITKIISSVFTESLDGIVVSDYQNEFGIVAGKNPVSVQATTLGDLSVIIYENTAKIIPPSQVDISNLSNTLSWNKILDQYPGRFTAGVSKILLSKTNNTELVGYLSQDPIDDAVMNITWDYDTLPSNTLIENPNIPNSARGTVDAIIDPRTFNPISTASNINNNNSNNIAYDTRYLLLDDIVYTTDQGPAAWANTTNTSWSASKNEIIQWDGSKWVVILSVQDLNTHANIFITNSRTGIQYTWDQTLQEWLQSYEGVYPALNWRLVL